jgi:hypothetical protein
MNNNQTIFKRGVSLTKEQFLQKSREVHGDLYDYTNSHYISSKEKIEINCPFHGIFLQPPRDHFAGHGCKKCYWDSRKRWTDVEDQYLIDHYNTDGALKCHRELGKTLHAVRGRAQGLGLSQKQNPTHPHIPNHLWLGLMGRILEDGHDIDFDIDYLWELYQTQNGQCALTGWCIFLSQDRVVHTVSVDRIDSSLGYSKKNIQLTHKWVNRCKLNCDERFFYDICAAVTNHRKDLQSFQTEWREDLWNDREYPVQIRSLYDLSLIHI